MTLRHLHFVQAIDPLLGGGLATAGIGLNSAMLSSGIASKLVSTAAESQVMQGLATYKRAGPTKLFFSWPLTLDARGLIHQSDAVHAHGLYVYPNALFGYWAKKEGRTLVIHPHGFFEPWIEARSPRKKALASWAFEARNARYAQLWRALTVTEADQIRARGIQSAVAVIPNGIDLTQIDDALKTSDPIDAQQTSPVILLMSRLHPKKGIELFLGVWAVLSSKYPDWKVLIVGPDENGHRLHLETLIGESDLARSVEFRSAVSGKEKFKLLATADIFALPSYSEGFPMTVLEAAACARPVVLTRQCNFPELEAAGAGWQCEPENASLKRTLCRAMDVTAEERSERGRAGRRLIERCYNWEMIAEQLDQACAHARG